MLLNNGERARQRQRAVNVGERERRKRGGGETMSRVCEGVRVRAAKVVAGLVIDG